ncbi:ribonuclease E inhibitor RraA/Dimethylmenaquinone methyltransferase [Diaporthe sp. PMI_573]|nr:ribonuclease E inhibitor RraA/Dimethylmenaquinone methyltransferase [Diaporthaceae sp. PMI_573]
MSLNEKLNILSKYSLCDISDALVRLQKGQGPPFGGHLAGQCLISSSRASQANIVAPAMTVRYVSVHSAETLPPGHPPAPPGGQYVDMVSPGRVVIIDQEQGLRTALLGANMATRIRLQGAQAVVVAGKVRDLAQLKDSEFPIWAEGSSPVAYSAEAKVIGVDIPVVVHGLRIEPGDIIFCDAAEGIGRIPWALLDDVVSLVPKLAGADDLVHMELTHGATFRDAIMRHPK